MCLETSVAHGPLHVHVLTDPVVQVFLCFAAGAGLVAA